MAEDMDRILITQAIGFLQDQFGYLEWFARNIVMWRYAHGLELIPARYYS